MKKLDRVNSAPKYFLNTMIYQIIDQYILYNVFVFIYQFIRFQISRWTGMIAFYALCRCQQ